MSRLPLVNSLPRCDVITFPVDKRVGDVRNLARRIAISATVRIASENLTRALKGIRLDLARLGIPEAEVAEQIDAFRLAVDRELVRIAAPWRIGTPDQFEDDDGGHAA